VLDLTGNPMTSTRMPAENLPAGRRVDTAPAVTAFSTSMPAGAYKANTEIDIRATMSEDVQANSSFDATLNLETGIKVVTLRAQTQGKLLIGTYKVQTGQNVGNLAVTSFTAGNVLDLAGNSIKTITLPSTNLAGIAIDTIAPAAPTLSLGTGVAGGATFLEATQSSGVVRVTGVNGARISVTFSRGTKMVPKEVDGTGVAEAVKLSDLEVDELGDGAITVTATQIDRAGNPQVAAPASTTFTLDRVAPSITITSNSSTLQLGQTAKITFELSEPSTNFTGSDITASGGRLSGFSGSGQFYSTTFTPDSVSLVGTVAVAAGTFTDAAGNVNLAGSLAPLITIDRTIRASAPGFTTTPPGTTIAAPVTTMRINFNAPVTGFTLASLKLFYIFNNADVAMNLTGVAITPLSASSYQLTLPANTNSLLGRYRLDIGGVGSGIVSGGVPMNTVSSIFWQRV
jgi:hypothetical protein